MEWEKQQQPPQTAEELEGGGGGGGMFVKVMTDEQMEVLRKQIAVYATICEQLVDLHKSMASQHDLAGVRLGNLYCDPLVTSAGHKITGRQRWTPTPMQLQILERIFDQGNGTPSKQKIKEITSDLSQHGQISETNVYNWFQNRRARSKRKQQVATTNNTESEVETEVESPNEKKTRPEDLQPPHMPTSRAEDVGYQNPEVSSGMHSLDPLSSKPEPVFPSEGTSKPAGSYGEMSFYGMSNPRMDQLMGKMEVPGSYHPYLHAEHLHTFIFVLAVSHVTFSALTILFGGIKIRQWKSWEDSIQKEEYDPEEVIRSKVTHVQDHDFVKGRFLGFGKRSTLLSWLHSFVKQFFGSVTKSDYTTLRLGFIMSHCKGSPKFNFHKYMIRVLEADFKKVVGISWYLWVFVVLFLLLNVHGWHAYFWIAFVPFGLLLAVGTKLEHVITQLAGEVAAKHVAVEGDLVVKPSDDHFWFHRPRLVLLLIHIILFQNSFEIAFFFWIWAQYHFNSCIMGQVGYIIPRLVIGVFVQFLCSYSTLPLYAIVTQMGSSFKKEIFDEHIQDGLVFWAKKAKRRATNGSSQVGHKESSPSPMAVQLSQVEKQESAMEEGNAGEIRPATNQLNSKVN